MNRRALYCDVDKFRRRVNKAKKSGIFQICVINIQSSDFIICTDKGSGKRFIRFTNRRPLILLGTLKFNMIRQLIHRFVVSNISCVHLFCYKL